MSDPAPPEDAAANSDQIAFWSGAQGDKWVRLQKRIDDMLAPFGREVLKAAAIRGGEQVLDVGCGTGDMSLRLADAVGPGGGVTGVDVSRPMLQRATARAAAIPELNLRFVEADAQAHPFESESFDRIVSRFGVMFFEDPAGAFANLRHATKPRGRLAFVAWRDRRENPWATLPARMAKPHVELPPTPPPNSPGQFAFADDGHVRSVLEAGGWREIACAPFDTRINVGRDAADAAAFLIEMGPAAGPIAEAGPRVADRVRAALEAALAEHAGANGVTMDYAVWVVTATA